MFTFTYEIGTNAIDTAYTKVSTINIFYLLFQTPFDVDVIALNVDALFNFSALKNRHVQNGE